MLKTFLTAVLAAILALSYPALAAAPRKAAPALSEADRDAIARVETYMNGIKTLKSDFLQTAEDGSTLKGTFYLSRPGRMRLVYDGPVKNFVVADGKFVYFWDDELKQQSNAPIGSTLADVILRENLTLSGDVTVTGVEQNASTIELTVIQTKDPGQGRLTLIFEDRPLRLRKWRVVDAQGLTTEVALLNPQTDVKLDRDLFYFRDPARRDRDRE